ncbi:hypothetical protein ACIBG7_43275 [Nonomuraea sp. NPDC050328]|uniref:hypothetical protein n=1 Tax=Nonomuraea sp. NPDC050328 TaxID=3364361 RepID=UPI003790C029
MSAPLYPQIIAECQFTEPTWSDISPWLRGALVRSGVSRVEAPIVRYDTGTTTITLDNRDRRFDPTNLAGPYVEGGGGGESGVHQFTCTHTQVYGHGWTIDIKSAAGTQASIVNVSSKATGTTGSTTVDKPSGTAAGHRLIAVQFSDVGTLGDLGNPTGGAGWGTPIASRTEGDDTLQSKVWAKTAGGAEPATYGFTQNSGADGVIFIIAVRDWDPLSSEIVLSQSNSEAAVFNTPSTTPHAADDLELRLVGASAGTGQSQGGANWMPPQEEGWAEWGDTQSGSFTTGALAAKQLTSVGAGTGTRVKPGRPIRLRAVFPLTPTTNLITNPSLEVDTSGWAALAGSAIARVPDVSRTGGYSLEVRRTAAAAQYGVTISGVAAGATVGETVTISAHIYVPAAAYAKVTGVRIGATGVAVATVSTAGLQPDTWCRVSRTAVLSAGLANVQIQVIADGTLPDGQIVAFLDAVQAEEAAAATPYCDGAQPGCTWSGTAHASSSSRGSSMSEDLFTGFADDWLVSWSGTYDSEVTVPCTDALDIIAGNDRAPVAAVGAGEDSGARVHRILDSVGWPVGARQIDVGSSTLQATTLEGSGLSELQLVADTEIGELYQNASGDVVFRNRQAILTDERTTTVQARFGPGGEASGRLGYKDVGIAYDRQQMANEVRITRAGGSAAQVAIDAASIAEYNQTKTYERTDLIMQSDAEALSAAQWLLSVSKEPELRFDSLEVWGQADPVNLFPQILGRRIGDRIEIDRRPVGGGDPVVREVIIRGVSHEIRGVGGGQPRWVTIWQLQSAQKSGNFWTLGHPTLGRVDTNALVY